MTLIAALALVLPGVSRGADQTSPEAPKFRFEAVLFDLEPTSDRSLRDAGLFYAGVTADWKRKGWGAHAEVRGTEGKFRPYYEGSVWLEEGYAFVTTPAGELRMGKLQRPTLLADETFGGNLFSVNGATRNPDLGAMLAGEKQFELDRLSWWLTYYGQNDHVAWEDDGRGVESDPAAKLRDAIETRVSYLVYKGLVTYTPGVSFATGRIVRDELPDLRRNDYAGDFTATFGPIAAAVELLRRTGEAATSPDARLGYDDAWAGLFHFRVELPTFLFRYTYSDWRYRGAEARERIHQPALVWFGVKGIHATVEYAGRHFSDGATSRTFNAFQLGLALSYQ